MNTPNKIQIIRDYEAPIQSVWTAWTDPKILDQWWGPRGFSHKTHSFEAKEGGDWRYTMYGPDKIQYPNLIRYIKVDKHQLLEYDHGTSYDEAPHFRVTVSFHEVDRKTRMIMNMTFQTTKQAQDARLFIRQAGGESTWDRLGEYLIKVTSNRDVFVINRTFEVPVTMLSEMWTNPDHLSKWLPPTGATMEFIRADLRQGGSCFYVMNLDQGGQMYGRSSYLTIEKPHKIIYLQQFCDKDENITRHPMAQTWPETMKTIVTLTSEGESRTRVNLIWEPFGAVQASSVETFINARSGMTQGWTGSFNKFEDYAVQFLASPNANLREKVS